MSELLNTPFHQHRLRTLILFALSTLGCVALVATRMHVTSRPTFVFLIWNIFLAGIPYILSTVLILVQHRATSRRLALLLIPCWLVFFPNAPYILTDLFHLRPRTGVPYWYDLVLILSFAFNGLLLGYASLLDVQRVVAMHTNRMTGWVFSIASLVLAGFGVYLGRYLRWNSWDVIASPSLLFEDITRRLADPLSHPQTFGVTALFSAFLVGGYLLLVHLIHPAEAERR
jgi:uncharacterized membrane protein